MKWIVLSVFVFGATLFTEAQVIFRNDFIIGRHHKIKNKGLSFITINLDKHPNMNMLVNGRGGRSIVIDVNAIKYPRQNYTYTEIAERIYTPTTYRPSEAPVPMFLLMPPPAVPELRMPDNSISRIYKRF
jgi:hypothetical protein